MSLERWTSDKRSYFAGAGAVGGVVSGILQNMLGVSAGAFSSWAVGTAFDGALIGGALAFAQGRYVGKAFDWPLIRKPMQIGAIGGFIGGLIAYLFMSMPMDARDLARIVGWAVGGAAVGFALSRVVPNLKQKTASIAGCAGGGVGCIGMYMIGNLWVGTAITGAAIGIVVAMAESHFRERWLEVTIKPKGISLEKERTLNITLGDKFVLFGCSNDADVRLQEIAGAGRYFAKVSLAGDKVHLEDLLKGGTRELQPDQPFEIGAAHAVLRAKV